MEVILRKAFIDDLKMIQAWDKEPHVAAAIGADEDIEDQWLEKQLTTPSPFIWIYSAEINNQPIGCLQICDPVYEETHYWESALSQLKLDKKELSPNADSTSSLRAIDIWIGPKEYLGKGYGTQMMKLAHELCFQSANVTKILIDPLISNVRAIRFYKKLGYSEVKNHCFGDDHCLIMLFQENY